MSAKSTDKEIEKIIDQTLEESLHAKREFWRSSRSQFFAVGRTLVETVKQNGKVLIFGNGGSGCDALHFAGEWVNRYVKDRPPLPCVALTADAPLITCIANDDHFDAIFERQVLAIGRKGDVAIGISTSGNSKNVIRALQVAKKAGLKTIALTGGSGGTIIKERIADQCLLVDATQSTPRIQEVHEWVLHELSEYVEFEIFGTKPA